MITQPDYKETLTCEGCGLVTGETGRKSGLYWVEHNGVESVLCEDCRN